MDSGEFDAVFTANTFHIINWENVKNTLEGAANALRIGGVMVVYGPFLRDGEHE